MPCRDKLVVLVGSHDRYRAAWPPFCHGMKKYWPDCPWQIKFVTNRKTAPCGESLKIGGGRDFSGNIKHALKKIEVPAVLLTLEEHWLTGPPDTKALRDFAQIILQDRADHIRLIPTWKAKRGREIHKPEHKVRSKGAYEPDPRLLIFADNSAYRTAAGMGFWNTEVLRNLLKPGESIWAFETRGSRRSERYPDRFLCVREHKYVRYVSSHSSYNSGPIAKGKWTAAAKRYAKEEGLVIDFSRDPERGNDV